MKQEKEVKICPFLMMGAMAGDHRSEFGECHEENCAWYISERDINSCAIKEIALKIQQK